MTVTTKAKSVGGVARLLSAVALAMAIGGCTDQPFEPQHTELETVNNTRVIVLTDSTARVWFTANNSEDDFLGYALLGDLYRSAANDNSTWFVRDQDTIIQMLELDGSFTGDTFFNEVHIHKDSSVWWKVCSYNDELAISERIDTKFRAIARSSNLRMSWGWPRAERTAIDIDGGLRPYTVPADTNYNATGGSSIDTASLSATTIGVQTVFIQTYEDEWHKTKEYDTLVVVDTVTLSSSMYYIRSLLIDTVNSDTITNYDKVVLDTDGADTLFYVDTILNDSIADIHVRVDNDTVYFAPFSGFRDRVTLIDTVLTDTARVADFKLSWAEGPASVAHITGGNGGNVIYCEDTPNAWFSTSEIASAQNSISSGNLASTSIGNVQMTAADSIVIDPTTSTALQPSVGDAFIVISGQFSADEQLRVSRLEVESVEATEDDDLWMSAKVAGRIWPAYIPFTKRTVIFNATKPGVNQGNALY